MIVVRSSVRTVHELTHSLWVPPASPAKSCLELLLLKISANVAYHRTGYSESREVLSQWGCTRLSLTMKQGEVERDQRIGKLMYTVME